MALRRLFISDTVESPRRQISLSQYNRFTEKMDLKGNSLVTMGLALLCTFIGQVSQEMGLFG